MTRKLKNLLHPRNRHQVIDGVAYNFDELTAANPDLEAHIVTRNNNHQTIDFADSLAVKELNRALLLAYYGLQFWQLPDDVLCPPIPGRADYIHYLADLLAQSNGGNIPTGKKVKGIDIGTGANLIYPIVGRHEYKWSFIGTEVNPLSFQCATTLTKSNPYLKSHVKVKLQDDPSAIFKGIVNSDQRLAFSICNPPFHSSAKEAAAANRQKVSNLEKAKSKASLDTATNKPSRNAKQLNFGGQHSELWCDGGEVEFVCKMIRESVTFQNQVLWFSSLVSKKDSLQAIEKELKKHKTSIIKVVDMGQGNKLSRFIAWSFIPLEQHQQWFQ